MALRRCILVVHRLNSEYLLLTCVGGRGREEANRTHQDNRRGCAGTYSPWPRRRFELAAISAGTRRPTGPAQSNQKSGQPPAEKGEDDDEIPRDRCSSVARRRRRMRQPSRARPTARRWRGHGARTRLPGPAPVRRRPLRRRRSTTPSCCRCRAPNSSSPARRSPIVTARRTGFPKTTR